MDCSAFTVKELRELCKKHNIKGCSGLRKKQLCQRLDKELTPDQLKKSEAGLPRKITNEASFNKRDCSRKRVAWTKKQLKEFCDVAKIECSDRDSKKALCRKIAAHFRGEAKETPESFSTKEGFKQKECGPPRKGWLHRELVAVCKALRLKKNCEKDKKAELCTIIADYFEESPRRASSGRRQRHRVRAPPASRLTSKTYMETLPPDIARYAGKAMSIRDILAMCETNPTLARHLCNSRFWREYYTDALKELQRTKKVKDWDFLGLVAFKVYLDWLARDGRPGKVKTVIAIQPQGDEEYTLLPMMVPKESLHQRRRGRGSLGSQLARRIEDLIGSEIVEVSEARVVPRAAIGWERRGQKMFKQLRDIAGMI